MPRWCFTGRWGRKCLHCKPVRRHCGGICQRYVRQQPEAARRAGFGGTPTGAANSLFKAIIGSPSGVVFASSEYDDSWAAVRRPGQKIELFIAELLPELAQLDTERPPHDLAWPFVLSAGERRSDTSNTSIRDAGWHRKGTYGTLRMGPVDARRSGAPMATGWRSPLVAALRARQ